MADFRNTTTNEDVRLRGLAGELEKALTDHYFLASQVLGCARHYLRQRLGGDWSAVEIIRALLWASDDDHEGTDTLMALLAIGRADAAVESIVLDPKFRDLFSAMDRDRARTNLAQGVARTAHGSRDVIA
jgi:hypothetical protein